METIEKKPPYEHHHHHEHYDCRDRKCRDDDDRKDCDDDDDRKDGDDDRKDCRDRKKCCDRKKKCCDRKKYCEKYCDRKKYRDRCDYDDKYDDKYDGKYDDKYDGKYKDRHLSHHIHELDVTIKALADSLASLGRGTHLQELLRIIHCPGWTSSAELAFVNAILDHISVEVRTLDRLQADLVEASRKVTNKYK